MLNNALRPGSATPPADEPPRNPEEGAADSSPAQAASDGGFEKPTVDHTSLPPELWLEIFRYATHVPRARSIAPADPFVPERPVDYARGITSPAQSMRTKCALVRVCHAWRVVATELLYEHVVLGSVRRVDAFCKTLRESRKEAKEGASGSGEQAEGLGHGQWVRHLEVQCWARSNHSRCYWQCVIYVVSYCPRLRVFNGLWQEPLPNGFLPVLERYLPSTLQEIYWRQDSVFISVKELPILTTPVLARFPTLRVLDLRKICIFDAERSLQHITFESITLPYVTHLALPTCPLLLRYASKQVMPALNHLALDASGAPRTVYPPLATKELANFLDKHGQQLRTVELLPLNTQSLLPSPVSISAFLSPTACPNLETLVFDCREKVISVSSSAHRRLYSEQQQQQSPPSGSVGPSGRPAPTPAPSPPSVNLEHYNAGMPSLPPLEEPHPTLRRIGLRGASINKLYPNKPTQAQAHLEALVAYRAFFPALELVRTLGFLVGTSTDVFAPDVFIWWTERFERVGVDLQDGEGVVWMLEEQQPPATAQAAPVGSEGLAGANSKDAEQKAEVGADRGDGVEGQGERKQLQEAAVGPEQMDTAGVECAGNTKSVLVA